MNDILALRALTAVMADEPLRDRFLALTGYDPQTLRARAGEADVLDAVIAFLCAHEPDLVKTAAALSVTPEILAGARA
ncbi:DUF3572 family protein [Sandaracinobacteroides sp. A072]|uniref:DUF3572 family protein n=1 Tax=Sandaracinobacteroides sp. A072 TaxID=3461146 RepID=UPI0040430948